MRHRDEGGVALVTCAQMPKYPIRNERSTEKHLVSLCTGAGGKDVMAVMDCNKEVAIGCHKLYSLPSLCMQEVCPSYNAPDNSFR